LQPEPGKNRWETTVMLNNDNRVQIGVTDRYAGQFYRWWTLPAPTASGSSPSPRSR
jgi:hypothetical protein